MVAPQEITKDTEEKTDPNLVLPQNPVAQRMPDLGALDSLIQDPKITEIMVNDLRNVMVESGGKISFSGYRFPSSEELSRVVRNLLDSMGKVLTPEHPAVDGTLPDGSRVQIVSPPISLLGTSFTIRKFPVRNLRLAELLKLDAMSPAMGQFLSLCVKARLNILISGGTGSGKTTLLGALLGEVPASERLILIEDTAELALAHSNSLRLLTRPAAGLNPGVPARELLAHSLRMRPDRILLGELRRGEAFDFLQAMNTGHEGSMSTLHSNSPRDALARLETLCLMGGVELPLLAIRKQITAALDLIIQIRRSRDGKRRITQISELTGIEGDTLLLQDLFVWEFSNARAPEGAFKATGFIPTFIEKAEQQGVVIPRSLF